VLPVKTVVELLMGVYVRRADGLQCSAGCRERMTVEMLMDVRMIVELLRGVFVRRADGLRSSGFAGCRERSCPCCVGYLDGKSCPDRLRVNDVYSYFFWYFGVMAVNLNLN
jgi:hypothetical protein